MKYLLLLIIPFSLFSCNCENDEEKNWTKTSTEFEQDIITSANLTEEMHHVHFAKCPDYEYDYKTSRK